MLSYVWTLLDSLDNILRSRPCLEDIPGMSQFKAQTVTLRDGLLALRCENGNMPSFSPPSPESAAQLMGSDRRAARRRPLC